MTKFLRFTPMLLLVTACSPPPPAHPALSPGAAQLLLRYDTRAANHLKALKSQDPTCEYVLKLPDQGNHPDSVEVDHIAFCSGRSDLKAFDTNAEYRWNKTENKWELFHIGS